MEDNQFGRVDSLAKVELSSLRNGHELRDTDIFIAVMGVTGAGKSTLISHLTNDESKPRVGSGLGSCGSRSPGHGSEPLCCARIPEANTFDISLGTQEMAVFRYRCAPEINIYLIATPCLSNSDVSETNILRNLAAELAAMYSKSIPLHGILYLHRISNVNIQGSAMKDLRIFKRLCDPSTLRRVILVTSFWEQVSETVGIQREIELRTESDFWGSMLANGSRIERHMADNTESARRLVDVILRISEQRGSAEVPLNIQQEMVDRKTSLRDTEAVKEILTSMEFKEELLADELGDAIEELEEAPGDHSEEDRQRQNIRESEINVQTQQKLIQRVTEELSTGVKDLIMAEAYTHEDDKEQRLREQYIRISTEQPSPSTSSHSTVSERQSSQPSNARYPWFNRVGKFVSLSLRGRHSSSVGPIYSKS
ncbi:hypothetical protein SCUP515_12522 [Seiridium cupressi]